MTSLFFRTQGGGKFQHVRSLVTRSFQDRHTRRETRNIYGTAHTGVRPTVFHPRDGRSVRNLRLPAIPPEQQTDSDTILILNNMSPGPNESNVDSDIPTQHAPNLPHAQMSSLVTSNLHPQRETSFNGNPADRIPLFDGPALPPRRRISVDGEGAPLEIAPCPPDSIPLPIKTRWCSSASEGSDDEHNNTLNYGKGSLEADGDDIDDSDDEPTHVPMPPFIVHERKEKGSSHVFKTAKGTFHQHDLELPNVTPEEAQIISENETNEIKVSSKEASQESKQVQDSELEGKNLSSASSGEEDEFSDPIHMTFEEVHRSIRNSFIRAPIPKMEEENIQHTSADPAPQTYNNAKEELSQAEYVNVTPEILAVKENRQSLIDGNKNAGSNNLPLELKNRNVVPQPSINKEDIMSQPEYANITPSVLAIKGNRQLLVEGDEDAESNKVPINLTDSDSAPPQQNIDKKEKTSLCDNVNVIPDDVLVEKDSRQSSSDEDTDDDRTDVSPMPFSYTNPLYLNIESEGNIYVESANDISNDSDNLYVNVNAHVSPTASITGNSEKTGIIPQVDEDKVILSRDRKHGDALPYSQHADCDKLSLGGTLNKECNV